MHDTVLRRTRAAQSFDQQQSKARELRLQLPSVLALMLTALLSSCVSGLTAGLDADDALRVTVEQRTQGQHFEMVSPAHTDPVELYSRTTRDASTKVAEGAQVKNVIEMLADGGMAEYGKQGAAPRMGPETIMFEVETPSGHFHWGTNPATPLEERKAMVVCFNEFLMEFNRVQAFQSFAAQEGDKLFKKKLPGAPTR